jgi:hypothetical protein
MYANQKALAQAFNNDRLNIAFDSMNKEFLQFGVVKQAEIDTEYKTENKKQALQKETKDKA